MVNRKTSGQSMGASQLAVALCLAIGITFSAPGLGSEGRSVASVPFDGTEHNEANPTWGSTFIQLRRLCSSVYADGVSELAGPTRPGARTISNTLMSQESSVVDPRGLSDMVWQFGQFLGKSGAGGTCPVYHDLHTCTNVYV